MNWSKNIGDWYKIPEIKNLVSSQYMRKVLIYLNKEYENKLIYPQKKDVFKCFKLCSPKKLKVVILGQDPYYDGSANGLAFSNNDDNLKLSPSLIKIQESVERSVYKGFNLEFDHTLESWAKQGVLLLNTSLTVQSNKPTSHFKIWDLFTKHIIKIISTNYPGTIFVLWGNKAQTYQKNELYDLKQNCYILKAVHPAASAYNKKDWETNNFNEINKIIEKQNGKEFCIKW